MLLADDAVIRPELVSLSLKSHPKFSKRPSSMGMGLPGRTAELLVHMQVLSSDSRELRKQISGNGLGQFPTNSHRTFALVRDVFRRPKEPRCATVWRDSGKQEHRRSKAFMILITNARCTIGPSSRLAFPMDQVSIDCVVSIASGGREAIATFVQSKSQKVAGLIGYPENARLPKCYR